MYNVKVNLVYIIHVGRGSAREVSVPFLATDQCLSALSAASNLVCNHGNIRKHFMVISHCPHTVTQLIPTLPIPSVALWVVHIAAFSLRKVSFHSLNTFSLFDFVLYS